jgi:HEAT repeat protein
MIERPTAMISSTLLDLPDHREQVKDACMRQGVYPLMMEYIGAADADAVAKSKSMVDEADLYLGIFGYRYGTVPPGYETSITAMEYEWATERAIPRLIFLMGPQHLVPRGDVHNESPEALAALLRRLEAEHVRASFDSAEELRGLVIQALSDFRRERLEAVTASASGVASRRLVLGAKRTRGEGRSLHYVRTAPAPPEAYVAHPYTLLETRSLIGRRDDLNLLTDWVARPESVLRDARLLAIVAVGGMGKSALTWTWFNDVAPLEMTPLSGRMWWSFYESDATFENFVAQALAYTTERTLAEVEEVPILQRESELLTVLDERPFLIGLDGLERVLLAYARIDAAHLVDGELDQQSAEATARDAQSGPSSAKSFYGQHRLRRATDPRVGKFLQQLLHVRSARILVSSRLFPAELQNANDRIMPGGAVHFLHGLGADDAVELWRHFELSGSRDELVPLFESFDNYPLLIRALAGEVERYRPAPRDFDRWRSDHPDFDPFSLPLTQIKSHVLEFALRGLSPSEESLLHTIAAFRSPAGYDTLTALLMGRGKTYRTEMELDADLSELEDRGLIGWDRRANRYDQHPVVRGVAWHALDGGSRKSIYESMERHFAALPEPDDEAVQSVEDLGAALELFYAVVNLERFGDAWDLFVDRLLDSLIRLGEWERIRELVEVLFSGHAALPQGLDAEGAGAAFAILALSLEMTGRPDRGVEIWKRAAPLLGSDVGEAFLLLALDLVETGAVAEASLAADQAEKELSGRPEDGLAQIALGVVALCVGRYDEAARRLRAARESTDAEDRSFTSLDCHLVRSELARGDPEGAEAALAAARGDQDSGELGASIGVEVDVLAATVVIKKGVYDTAERELRDALRRIRALRHVRAEIAALLELAELSRLRTDFTGAREQLRNADELIDRGHYVLRQIDALNLRAAVEHSAGDEAAAIKAADRAFRLAWCDGPPFAYLKGLDAAREMLGSLSAPIPQNLPPFDPEAHAAAEAEFLPRFVDSGRQSLIEALGDDSPAVRRDAVGIVASLKGVDIEGLLLPCVSDPAWEVRVAVITALTDAAARESDFRGTALSVSEPTLKALAGALDDENATVRRTALERLTLAEPSLVGKRLAGALADPDRLVREAALEIAPAVLGFDDAVDVMARHLSDGDPRVRAVAASNLAILGHPDAIAPLISIAQDPDERIRLLATQGLTSFGYRASQELDDPATVASLIRLLDGTAPSLRHAAASALGQFGGDEAREVLERSLDDPAIAETAAVSLFRAHNPAAVDYFDRRLAHPDGDTRRRALGHLASMMPETSRRLLSSDLDGVFPFLDVQEPIDEQRIAEAAQAIGRTPDEVQQLYKQLSETIPLKLSLLGDSSGVRAA